MYAGDFKRKSYILNNINTMTFLELTQKVLREVQKPMNSEEIWEFATLKSYDKELRSVGKTPWATIGAQVYVNIRDKNDSQFAVTTKRPKRFYLKSLKYSDLEILSTDVKEKKSEIEFHERELHSFLTYYNFYYQKAYSKTIFHEKSSKKQFNQWIHPDMVGVHFPIGEWKDEVLDFSREVGSPALKLFSFEIKKELGFHNLRESFFQTVSNSSWANEAYLVTAAIDKNEDFNEEIKRLNSSFGIGIILLDINNPDSSEIILNAKPKEILDWESINKLADENPDFRAFLKSITFDFKNKRIHKEDYDKILDADKLKIKK